MTNITIDGDQTWVLTRSGIAFDLIDLDPDAVVLEDIAFALGKICRYTGHPEPFYGVGEHSVVMSRLVAPPLKMHVLLHDSPEAYLNDMATPVKLLFPEYKQLESKVEAIIYEHFGIKPPTQEMRDDVHDADVRMHVTEREQLMPVPPKPWSRNHSEGPYDYQLHGWEPNEAGDRFMERFQELIGELI